MVVISKECKQRMGCHGSPWSSEMQTTSSVC